MDKSNPEKSQPERFIDLARQLECDEDETRFEDQVRKIASVPKDDPKKDQE